MLCSVELCGVVLSCVEFCRVVLSCVDLCCIVLSCVELCCEVRCRVVLSCIEFGVLQIPWGVMFAHVMVSMFTNVYYVQVVLGMRGVYSSIGAHSCLCCVLQMTSKKC